MSAEKSLESLYVDHLQTLNSQLEDVLSSAGRAGCAAEGVLFHSGRQQFYHRDDRVVVFQPAAHYRRWIPAQGGSEHVVLARPGRKPVVVRVRPRDFWHDTSPFPESHWESSVDLHEVEDPSQIPDVLGSLDGVVYFGDSEDASKAWGFGADRYEPDAVRLPLDWHRAVKTDYEVALTRKACERAAAGHLEAKRRFLDGASEREIHWAYLAATGHLEHELPYETIVALDHKSAILHYQYKRGSEMGPGSLLLIDAGAAHAGYAADVTRTFVNDKVHPVMAQLVERVDQMERELVAMVTPGRPYAEIHVETHRQIGQILSDLGVLKVTAEEAVDTHLTRKFMPHGVGHLIGLQVHDVGGHQKSPEGGELLPPDDHVLRNTRTLEPGHLVTIEPGVYFIPMLLDPVREGEQADAIDWGLVDALTPFGGVRIEDDVLCTDGEPDDLTRGLIEGVSQLAQRYGSSVFLKHTARP